MSTRPISLLLVSYSYPPVLGGSEVEAQRVCAALLQRGHRIKALCAGTPHMPDRATWLDPYGVPLHAFGRDWQVPHRDRLFALGVAWTLWRERHSYQLVYFLMQGLHLAAGLPVTRLCGKPCVMKISGSNIITMMGESFLGRLELRWLRKWARRIMILNPGMAQEAAQAGLPENLLYWMPNPVDTDEFAPCCTEERVSLRLRLGIAGETPVIVYVGRLAPEKELASLLAAWALVVRQASTALLVVVGDGPDREALTERAKQLGVEARVHFTGRLPMVAVRQWLQAADIFTLVSSAEGFPCSLVEAMSVGLPSVVSDIPANLQLIDQGVHGLCAARDEESIATAIRELLFDSTLRMRMGEAARRRVLENYSMDKVLDRYETLFCETLAHG